MKKIAIATDSFLPRWDGISRFLSETIPKLDTDYEVKVIAPAFDGKYDDELLVSVERIPLMSLKVADYQMPKFAYKQIRKQIDDCDIVFTQTIGPIGGLSIFAGRRANKKVVAYIHSIEWELFPKSIRALAPIKWLVRKKASLMTRILYNQCDLLLVPSQEVANMLEKKGIKTPKKIVHMGTNTKIFSPALDKAAAKKAIGLTPDVLVVGFAGRIGLEKDVVTLYRAFSRIHRKHNAVLLIVGQDQGGVLKNIERSPKVKIVGTANNIAPYLKAMDVYVLSSLTETTSLSTIEAMSTGLAVVATPVGSVKEYVKDGYNGMIFPKQDVFELSKKLDKLLSDEILRKKIGSAARLTILDKFSWDKTVIELKSALDSLNPPEEKTITKKK
jgi:1,2-diacylglycerol 3-alpha-glucosyltransferase